MVFDNIFDPPKETKNIHPMTNPQYSNDIINDQGKQYKKYQNKRRDKALRKNKGLVEGFIESMTASEKNKSDLATLMKLQTRFDSAVKTMNAAAKNSTTTATSLVNNESNQNEIFNKYPANPGDVDGMGNSAGCRVDSANRVLPMYQGMKTHEECAQRAHDLGKTAYGIQDAMGWGSNGWGTATPGTKGQCFIGDSDKIGSDRSYHTGNVTWTTGNKGVESIYVGYNGSFHAHTSDGKYVWGTGSDISGCSFGPPGISDITATYGMNCQYETKYTKFLWWRIPYQVKRDTVYTGNESSHFNSLNGKDSGSVTISASSWGDPAYGCGKEFNATYKCGSGTATKSVNLSKEANGKSAKFDCTDLPCSDKIPYRLVMQDDGNLVIYDKTNSAIWATNTSGKNGDTPNQGWLESGNNKGDTLSSGETLYNGQFLCSKSGQVIAYISNGSLAIYQNFTNCTVKDGKTFGGPWANAVYTIDKNDVSTLGTISNAVEGNRRQWPDKFVSAGANFTAVTGYTIEAEGGTTISGKSLDEYKKIAAGDESIALFTTPKSGGDAIFYKKDCDGGSGAKQCFGEGFPTLQNRTPDPSWNIWVKNPRITSNDTCGKESEGIMLTTYNSYKAGSAMKECSPCGIASAMHEDYCTAQSESAKAQDEAKSILDEMKRLVDESIELQKVQPKLREQIYRQIAEYNETYVKTKKNQSTIITTGAQKGDSDLKVVADNFQFVMWTIIAIIAVTIAMKMTRKS